MVNAECRKLAESVNNAKSVQNVITVSRIIDEAVKKERDSIRKWLLDEGYELLSEKL
jgi:hypothetical protein